MEMVDETLIYSSPNHPVPILCCGPSIPPDDLTARSLPTVIMGSGAAKWTGDKYNVEYKKP